jgi:hypothetical protein
MNNSQLVRKGFLIMIMYFIGLMVTFLFLSAQALAQDVPVPSVDEWTSLLSAFGSLGSGKLAIIIIAVQALMLFVRQFLHGKYRLIAVSFLTLAFTIVVGLNNGQSMPEVITSASVLAALQVFGHNFINQFFAKKE